MCVVKNKFKLILLAAVMLTSIKSFTQIISDITGTLTWSLDTITHTLIFSGSGKMPDYRDPLTPNDDAPWYIYRNFISTVLIGDSVTSIGNSAFYNCDNLISVSIPDSVTSIGTWAFAVCSKLTSIIIPNKVTKIEDYIFHGCSNLTSVSIPDDVTSIGEHAFYQCSNLASINIPNKVTYIGYSAFQYCSRLTSVTIPDGVVIIASFAFNNCDLTSVTIPASVESIGIYAFGMCSNLKTINVSSNNMVFSSEDGVLFDKSKTILIQYPTGKMNSYYAVPNSVENIANSAFRTNIRISTLIIPNSVKIIGQQVFADCINLKSITIGNSVDSISYGAFHNCIGLKNIYSLNKNPPLIPEDGKVFSMVDKDICVLHVPTGSKSQYILANEWKEFLNIEENIGIVTITNDELRIFPNPTDGKLKIENGELKMGNVELYDVVGKKHFSTFNFQFSIDEIDISRLANGMYFLKIDGKVFKVIKQ